MAKITLHEIRRETPMGSAALGNRKLRTKARAGRLARFLRARYGIRCVLHSWRIIPTAAEKAANNY